jgi:uncharacterized protein (TIGR03083 family)
MDNQRIFAACTKLRLDLADLVEGLPAEDLRTPSLCGEWTVREVVGHLVAVLTVPVRTLLIETAKRGFSPHRANAALAVRVAGQPVSQLVAALREHAADELTLPVVGVHGPLADLLVHGGDIRIPLRLDLPYDEDVLVETMEFLTTYPPGFVPETRLAGLALVATDVGRRWLAGSEVRGRLPYLMMAACGRAEVLDRLSGPGLGTLASRISSTS